MWTIIVSLLLLILVVFIILRLKAYFRQSYQVRLNQEIETDLAEEFPHLRNLDTLQEEDFLDWAEGLQQDERDARKGNFA
jgi:hypothetical protein